MAKTKTALLETLHELLPSLRDRTDAAPVPSGILEGTSQPEGSTEKDASEGQDTANVQKTDLDPVSEGDVRCFVADILSGDPLREARGYQRISQMGTQAVEPLYFFLSQANDVHAGRICAGFLRTLAPDLAERIHTDMESRTDPSVKLRLLQHAAPVLDEEAWQRVLVAALQQNESSTVREALLQLQTHFPKKASRLLLEILPVCPDSVGYEICVCLGKLGDPRCLPQLLGYLDKARIRRATAADRLLEGVCYALGYFNDPQVVQKLGHLLSSNGRLPWQKNRVHPGLRKAALRALERIGGDSACAVLKRYENDNDPWIRYRVRNFLKGKRPEERQAGQDAGSVPVE